MRFSVILLCSIALMWGKVPDRIHFVEDPWPPFTYGEFSSAPTHGFMVEVLTLLFHDEALTMTLYPWKRAIAMAQEGKVDGLMLTVQTVEREEDFVFSDEIWFDEMVLISSSTLKLSFDGVDSLKGLKVGTILGAQYSDTFQDALKKGIFQAVASEEIHSNIKKLSLGRIDAVIDSKLNICEALKSDENVSRYHFINPPFKRATLKIAISKRSPWAEHINIINQRIANLKKQKTFEELVNHYLKRCVL